jgi:large subunit ribosomal protein L7/L12
MAKIDERIVALEEKLKQLKLQHQRKEARTRAVEARRSRREELRRKVLVGAVVLAKVEDGSLEEKVLQGWLAPALTRAEDRALFGLDGEGLGEARTIA